MEPTGFRMFEFAPMGLILLAGGVLFLLTVGQRILPERTLLMAMITRERTAQFVTEVVLQPTSRSCELARRSLPRAMSAFSSWSGTRRWSCTEMRGGGGGDSPPFRKGWGAGR